jgi:hypothetical protein
MNFVAISLINVPVNRPVAAHFEITNLTGRVIARTTDVSERNRAGAIGLAKRRMGGVIEVDKFGFSIRTIF